MKKKIFWLIISCFLITILTLITACTTKYALNTSLTPADGGTITPAKVSYKGANVAITAEIRAGTYKDGTEVTLIANPASGYRFDHWSGDVTGTSTTTTFTVDRNMSITAHFTAQHSLNAYVIPVEGGMVNPSQNKYDEGTRVTLTATPSSDYRFDRWSGDVTGTSSTDTIIMDRDISVTAHFIAQYSLDTAVNPLGGGTVNPDANIYDEGARITFTATPSSGYRFDHWSGDITGTSGTTTITMDKDMSVTAHFIAQYSLNTAVAHVGGTVTPVSGTYDEGTVVTLTATPSSGYRFDHWSGDVTGTSTTTTVTVDKDMSVTAHFMSTGPANVVGTLPKYISPTAWGQNGCQWNYKVTFTEANGVEATIESIGEHYSDARGIIWIAKSGEWFDKTIVIPPWGSNTYISSVRSTNDALPDFRSGTVTVSFRGHDANGHEFSGTVSATLNAK